MGCASARAPIEEGLIAEKVILTGFEKYSSDRVVSAIRTHSTAKHLTFSQFEALKKLLNLNSVDTKEFYHAFEAQEPGVSDIIKSVSQHITDEQIAKAPLLHEEPLTALAVLVCDSNARDKSLALYRLFDEGFSNSLSESKLNELFSLVFRLAVELLPKLLKGEANEDVKKYLERAKQNQSRAVSAAVRIVKARDAPGVGPEEFANRILAFKSGLLMSAAGLREFAVDQTPKERAEGQLPQASADQPPPKSAESNLSKVPAESEEAKR